MKWKLHLAREATKQKGVGKLGGKEELQARENKNKIGWE